MNRQRVLDRQGNRETNRQGDAHSTQVSLFPPLHVSLSFLIVCLLLSAAAACAAEVLDQVPHDALGFVVVRNLSQTDARVGQALGAAGSRLPGPLALLKSTTNFDAGVDLRRDMLVVLLPSADDSQQYHLAVWLPVDDYEALVRSLDGDPARRIAAVTIAGEDLLVVAHGEWAVVMDPDERGRLEQLRNESSAPPPQLAEWSAWIDANDAAVVVLPAGMRALWATAVQEKSRAAAEAVRPRQQFGDSLFGSLGRSRRAAAGWPVSQQWIQSILADVPELPRWAAEVDSAACGMRLDDAGNVVIGLRLAVAQSVADGAPTVTLPASPAERIPRLYNGGAFVVTGSGRVSPRWAVPVVAPYLRQTLNELAAEFGDKLSEADVDQFRRPIEQAVAEVEAFGVLTSPGADTEPVFSNQLLALRVASTQRFFEVVDAAFAAWNTTFERTKKANRLVLEANPLQVAGHAGTEYSLDMATLEGHPGAAQLQAAMEKLFGKGGKLRLQAVGVDEHTVLLSAATEDQITRAIADLNETSEIARDQAELRDAAELLSDDSTWQLFLSLSGYSEQLRRQLDAVIGAVIGGPIVPEFPQSPPVGFAGGSTGRFVWTEMAVPVGTLQGLSKFLHQ